MNKLAGKQLARAIIALNLMMVAVWNPFNRIGTAVGAEKTDRAAAPTATTWYVATTGDDANSCTTAGSPCRTVGGAIGKATGGDTILIGSGTYTESNTIAKSLTLIGNGAKNTLLDGSGANRVLMNNAGITLTLQNLTVQHGSAGSYANGGGIYNQGRLLISNTHILNNYAGNFGSGIYNDNGYLQIVDSTIANNSTRAGIGQWSGTIIITNTTFTGNRGDAGGGALEAYGGIVRLNHITVVGNYGGSAGGLYYGGNAVNASFRNSIVAGNTSGNPSYPNCANLYSWGGNLLGASGGGCPKPTPPPTYPPDHFSDDPRVSALRDNGGPTLTRALLAGSPAVGIADLATCPTADQRGVTIGSTCDAGAVEGTSDLSVVKTAPIALLTPNVPLTYTIVVSNAGAMTATNAGLTDNLPNGLSFGSLQSTLPTCTGTSSIQCSWATLPPAGVITVTVRVTPTITGRFVNTVSVKQVQLEYLGDNDSTVTTKVGATDLGLSKRASSFDADVGKRITYTLSISNAGPTNTSGVVVSDVLPAGLNFAYATATRGSYSAVAGLWGIGSLTVGQIATLTLAVTPTIQAAGKVITNTAVISVSDLTDPNSTNDVARAPIGVGVNLGVGQTTDRSIVPVGLPISFTVTITNGGPAVASGIVVTNAWPAAQLAFISAAASQGTYTFAQRQWSAGSLTVGQTATLIFTGVPLPAANNTTVTHVAHIAAVDQSDTPNDSTATTSVQVTSPDIAVSKAIVWPQQPEMISDTIVYRIAARNVGAYAAQQLIISDVLPAPLTVITTTASAGTYDAQSGEWAFGPLDFNADAALTITAAVPISAAQQTFTNTAQLAASVPEDFNGANNSADSVAYIPAADVRLTKTATPSKPQPGQSVTFTLQAGNAGPDVATGVWLRDVLTDTLTFDQASVFVPDNVLRFNLDDVPALDGNSITDRSGGNHTGTLITNDFENKSRPGLWNRALMFDGVDDHVVVSRTVAASFTLSFWISTTQSSGDPALDWTQGHGLIDAGDPGFGLSLVSGQVNFGVNKDAMFSNLKSVASVADGSWHHIAATRAAATGALHLYIDGVLSASGPGAPGLFTALPNGDLWLGGLINGAPNNNFFNGQFDEVLIFDRALSAAEVYALYDRTTPYGSCTAEVLCEIGSLNNGEAVTVTLATTTVPPFTQLSNTAQIRGDQFDLLPENNTASLSGWKVYLPLILR
jgi:uncharacterized repeat protein (TIGR01451 family)